MCNHRVTRAAGNAGRGGGRSRRGRARQPQPENIDRRDTARVDVERRDDAKLTRLEKSRLRLERKWWMKRLVALGILFFSNVLRSWVRAVRARLVAARSNGSSQDVELPNASASVPPASLLGARCCSEVAASEQTSQRPRLAQAKGPERVISRPHRESLVFYCEPQIIIAVDPRAVERRHLDVRGIIEMYMQTRITQAVLCECSLQVHGHVGYVDTPSAEATDRIYPPTADPDRRDRYARSDRLRVHAVTVAHGLPPPVRLRVALINSDAGRSILQQWPLPAPGQRG